MNDKRSNPSWGWQTRAIHAGELEEGDDVDPPIHMSSTFRYASAEEAAQAFERQDRPIYTRWGNPTISMLQNKVAALEGGEAALAVASGMAAISTSLLTILKPGDHLLATSGLYSGSYHFICEDLPQMGIETSLAEATDPAAFEAGIQANTRAIYLESPGNPGLALNDIEAIVGIARSHSLKTLIDNTFASPYNQQPLRLGVDVAVHSATKFLGGHGDALGGLIIGESSFIEAAARGPLRHFGGVISPFNAWLIARGVQTLPLRMERHNQNALDLADWLSQHPSVSSVRYPWHASHPQVDLAKRQMQGGGGGVVVFELHGGLESGVSLLNRVQLLVRTVSLGDTLSLITHPVSTTHRSVPPVEREKAGISDGMVRLAVGLEDIEDLVSDLDQALQ